MHIFDVSCVNTCQAILMVCNEVKQVSEVFSGKEREVIGLLV